MCLNSDILWIFSSRYILYTLYRCMFVGRWIGWTVCLFVCLADRMAACLCTLYVCLSLGQLVRLCFSRCLSYSFLPCVCKSVIMRRLVCLTVCRSGPLSDWLSVRPSVCPTLCLPFFRLTECLSFCMVDFLSDCLSDCLYVWLLPVCLSTCQYCLTFLDPLPICLFGCSVSPSVRKVVWCTENYVHIHPSV
jgi:hypothetical protein